MKIILTNSYACVRLFAVFLIVFGTVFGLAACSGIKPYHNPAQPNLQVQVNTEVDTYLHIYAIQQNCQLNYQGSVELDKPRLDISLPVSENSYLVFTFSSSSFWSSSSGSMNYETQLKPRKGYRYEAQVSYIENIYNIELFEYRNKKSSKHAVKAASLNCP